MAESQSKLPQGHSAANHTYNKWSDQKILPDNCDFIYWLDVHLNILKWFFSKRMSKKINEEWNTDVQIYMAY